MRILFFMLYFLSFTLCSAYDPFMIHSTPKCGTHFLQTTITALTGKQCKDIRLCRETLEMVERANQIGRLHTSYTLMDMQYLTDMRYKLIAIYRDPRDAIVSLVVYMRRFKGQGVVRDFFEVHPSFDHLSFDQQLHSVMTAKGLNKNYFHYYLARVNWHFAPIAYGVRYENLVGSRGGGDDLVQVQEILNICQHINLPITLERAKQIASKIYHSSGVEMIEGKPFYHAQIGSWRNFMSPENKDIFKECFNDVLVKLGYEKDRNW